MTKLSRAGSACISAIIMLAGVASIAAADTFTYELNGSFAESKAGPSLVPLGGTLGPDSNTGLRQGYTFVVNEGLSLSGTGIFDAYSIHIRFYFYDVNASFNTFQNIRDFKIARRSPAFTAKAASWCYLLLLGPATHMRGVKCMILQMARADFVVTRNANGLSSASVVGHGGFSVMDTNGATTFSGPGNIINFFMDDLLSFAPEAGTGFIDRIR